MNFIYVAVGGCFGAILRYFLGEWLQTDEGFPIGTLLINLLGSLLLGWFLAFSLKKIIKKQYVLMIGTGFFGSFTTFSTLSVEIVTMIVKNQLFYAALYSLLSIFIGILLAYIGYKIGSRNLEKGAKI